MNKFKEILVSLLNNREECDYVSGGQLSFELNSTTTVAITYYKGENSDQINFSVYVNSLNGWRSEVVSCDLIEGNLLLSKYYALKQKCNEAILDEAINAINRKNKAQTFEDVRESLVSDNNE